MVTKAENIPKKKKTKVHNSKEINIDKVILLTVEMNTLKEELKALILKNKTMYSPGDKLTKANLKRDLKVIYKKVQKLYEQ